MGQKENDFGEGFSHGEDYYYFNSGFGLQFMILNYFTKINFLYLMCLYFDLNFSMQIITTGKMNYAILAGQIKN
jgi:hypothetical protein